MKSARRVGQAGLIAVVLAVWLIARGTAPGWAAPDPTAFYRLRVEVTSSAQWALVSFEDTRSFLAVAIMQSEGQVVWRDAGWWGMYLEQEQSAVQAGAQVGMTVEVALDPAQIGERLLLRLRKSDSHGVMVRVTAPGAGAPILLSEFRFDEPVGEDGLPILIGLGQLAGVQPESVEWPRPAVPRLLWAYYYPNFTQEIWQETPFVERPLVPYRSDDPEVLARQVEQAQSAGIDGFVVAYWGPQDDYGTANLRLLLDVAAARDFKIMLNLMHTVDYQRDADELVDLLTGAIDQYASHPAYMRLDGLPVFLSEYAHEVPIAVWAEVFERVRQSGRAFLYLGSESWNRQALAVFDGLASKHRASEPGEFYYSRQVADLVHGYALLMAQPAPRLWAAGVQPGWDDSAVSETPDRIPREDGAYLSRSFATLLYSDPDWVMLNSWNDWWADTQIEPAESYGSRYLELVRRWADWWRAQASFFVVTPGPGLGAGAWAVEYFLDEQPDGEFNDGPPLAVSEEVVLDLNWGEGAPAGLPKTDDFLVRATRTFEVPEGTEGLLIRAWSDDGLRVWLDRGTPGEQQLIDAWRERGTPPWPDAAYVSPLAPGQHTLTVEYFETAGSAVLRVFPEFAP